MYLPQGYYRLASIVAEMILYIFWPLPMGNGASSALLVQFGRNSAHSYTKVLSVPAVHLLLLLPQYLFPPASSNYSIPSITIKFNIIHQIVPQGISFTLDLSANRHMVADDLSSRLFFCEIINY